MSQNIKKELIELAKQLATPIDFEQLEKEGIIEKKGAWFIPNLGFNQQKRS